jgi:hypothetical protein
LRLLGLGILALCAMLAACGEHASGRAPAAPALAPHDEWVVLPDSVAVALTHQCRGGAPKAVGSWHLDDSLAALADSALLPVLDFELSAHDSIPPVHRPSREYLRQYAGVLVSRKRVIYVNGFNRGLLVEDAKSAEEMNRKVDTTYWHHDPVVVCDGWTWFFGAEIDPASLRVSNFEFNGIA